jgi:hypothetical protein
MKFAPHDFVFVRKRRVAFFARIYVAPVRMMQKCYSHFLFDLKSTRRSTVDCIEVTCLLIILAVFPRKATQFDLSKIKKEKK